MTWGQSLLDPLNSCDIICEMGRVAEDRGRSEAEFGSYQLFPFPIILIPEENDLVREMPRLRAPQR